MVSLAALLPKRAVRMRYPVRSRITGVCIVLFLFWMPLEDLQAQNLEACEAEILRAEEYYRDGEFEQAEQLLTPCLDGAVMSDELAVRGYRILAQSNLQTGNIAGARRAVLRVFARQPGYRADPVQDPPAYQALVETVRQQLDDPGFEADLERVLRDRTPPPPAPPPVPAYRTAGHFYLQLATGANSYGGERGTEGSTFFAEFADNAGPTFTVAGGFNATNYLALTAGYDFGRFPTITNQKSPAFPEIDPDVSSAWLHTLSGGVVARFLPTRLATPYVRGGVGASLIRLNDEMRSAVALDVGLGADIATSRTFGLFAEIGVRYALPGDAIDLVDRSGEHDILSLLRAGVSWNVGSIR